MRRSRKQKPKDQFGDLFAPLPSGMVRRGDPDTSDAAAGSVVPRLNNIRRQVLTCALTIGKPVTDVDIRLWCSERYGHRPESSYRKRRSELTEAGMFEDTGKRIMQHGSSRILWALTEAGTALAWKIVRGEV